MKISCRSFSFFSFFFFDTNWCENLWSWNLFFNFSTKNEWLDLYYEVIALALWNIFKQACILNTWVLLGEVNVSGSRLNRLTYLAVISFMPKSKWILITCLFGKALMLARKSKLTEKHLNESHSATGIWLNRSKLRIILTQFLCSRDKDFRELILFV